MQPANIFDTQYTLRRKVLTIAGAKFHIFDSHGNLAFYSKMKAFKLKEDIRLYSDESMQDEILSIKTQQIIDFGATYNVVNSKTQLKIGSFRRKGLKSLLRDEWIIFDTNNNQIGIIKEDSTALALVRRFLTNLIPQTFHVDMNRKTVCVYKQNFNPFVQKIAIDFSGDIENRYDRLLGIAGSILLCAIEGKQQ